jgi:hypothetical protein
MSPISFQQDMSTRTIRQLAPGYTSEIDNIDEQAWYQLLLEFDDANIYQAWSYAAVISGRRNMSHLILRRDGVVVAIVQARITRLPLINLGIAYVQWGPLWRRHGTGADPDIFRQAVRALRNEFVCKRGLTLRLFPIVFDDASSCYASVLSEEGLSALSSETLGRTILMNLNPALQDLREGMNAHWKRELKVADRNQMEVIEGSGADLFAEFIAVYKQMVSRKKFVEPNDINQFKVIQSQLPENLKMRVMLCRHGSDLCAGLIYSAMGNTAIYLFGATSNSGMKSRGSYFLQWKVIERLKEKGIAVYNLNGINPAKNPGTYKFKNDLAGKNGKDAFYVGRFEIHPGLINRSCIGFGDTLRVGRRQLRQFLKTARRSEQALKASS